MLRFHEQFQAVYVLVCHMCEAYVSQRNLRDGFLKAQDTSTFVILNPEYPIRRDKVRNHLRVCGIQYPTTSDSYLK